MRKMLTLVLLVAMSGLGVELVAQQQRQPNDQPGAQQQTDNRQSSQTFQGKIMRSGNQLVFQDSSTQSAYQLDDQSKVAPYEGKDVKLMATVDQKTNSLHVIDIAPAENK
jgi:hypothetical protein